MLYEVITVFRHVVVEAAGEGEAGPERRGELALSGGRADQGEAGEIEPDRAGPRALFEHDVDVITSYSIHYTKLYD